MLKPLENMVGNNYVKIDTCLLFFFILFNYSHLSLEKLTTFIE